MPKLDFNSLKAEYEQMWSTVQIRPDVLKDIDRIAAAITKNRSRYAAVEAATKVPWYAIGAIHNMEASLSFTGHLHNGDPLTGRTFQVPAGRPKSGSPPYKWEVSAIDALMEKVNSWWSKSPGWSIPEMLWKLEGYNGWGYRQYHPETKSPYLWAGTNHYKSGKYVADGRWSASAVSVQRGVATIIKRLVDSGAATGVAAAPDTNLGAGYGLGCVDAGAAGTSTLSMQNPQSQQDAIAYLLGLDARAKSQSHEFKATLNVASDPDILNLDIQKTLQVVGVSPELDGEYTCDDIVFTLRGSLQAQTIAYRPDPNAPAPSLFRHSDGTSTTPVVAGTTPPANVPAGEIGAKIYQAALASRGASSRQGPGGGNIACAWVINTIVLPKAGVKQIGSSPAAVASVESALKGGRGQLVSRANGQPGDICIMGDRHIGICLTAGCKQVLSNSSSKAKFSWEDTIEAYDRYYRVNCTVYRVTS